MKRISKIFIFPIAVLFTAVFAMAYPLDGSSYSEISRLPGYLDSLQTESGKRTLTPGALLSIDQVYPRLSKHNWPLPTVDRSLNVKLRNLLKSNSSGYSAALLDVSDPDSPKYAEHNAERRFIPGSVGKILAALAVFDALANIYPSDISQRGNVLRNTMITADEFIRSDSHEVPFWNPKTRRITLRPLQEGDRDNLWSYMDWMLSASSNAGASMVMKQIVLLNHFGKAYPPTKEEELAFFRNTEPRKLARLFSQAMNRAVTSAGLDPKALRQGSFFTKTGKQKIPSRGSYANARELMKFLLLIEQGRLIDKFTSKEMKRLLYATQSRIRYASAPALDEAAVYFKSGSLYRCRPEPGFSCRQYEGNLLNQLAAVAIVEYPAYRPKYHYLIVVSSDVLRQNSEQAHRRLAGQIQRLIQEHHSGSQ